MIADNLVSVRDRIRKSCKKVGRSADSVKLVAVTKQTSISQMEEAIKAGAVIFGENRVQDAIVKYRDIGDKVEWHLIGHLQTNKAKDAVKIFSLIHSVDSLKLAREIDKEAGKLKKRQKILIQVSTSGEETKFGIRPVELPELIKEASGYSNLIIEGLMTIAPIAEDSEAVRPYFRALTELIGTTGLKELSMGMTDDFEIAIEEGSTLVRVGRAIFNDKR